MLLFHLKCLHVLQPIFMYEFNVNSLKHNFIPPFRRGKYSNTSSTFFEILSKENYKLLFFKTLYKFFFFYPENKNKKSFLHFIQNGYFLPVIRSSSLSFSSLLISYPQASILYLFLHSSYR